MHGAHQTVDRLFETGFTPQRLGTVDLIIRQIRIVRVGVFCSQFNLYPEFFTRMLIGIGIFPENMLPQEFSTERWIDIPEPVLEKLYLWRPSPLVRARNLEQALGTPAKIFYKHEGVSPAGRRSRMM